MIWKKSCEVRPNYFVNFWYLTIGEVNATAEQKTRILEGRVTENLETIEQLRQERSLLAADHKQLQRRFTELTEVRDSDKVFPCELTLNGTNSKQANFEPSTPRHLLLMRKGGINWTCIVWKLTNFDMQSLSKLTSCIEQRRRRTALLQRRKMLQRA